MKFNNLAELAKAVSLDILHDEFMVNKKFPINKELKLNIDLLPKDENGDMAREDPEEFMRLLNNCVTNRLKYLYEEGFLEKKKYYYYALTEQDIKDRLEELEKGND